MNSFTLDKTPTPFFGDRGESVEYEINGVEATCGTMEAGHYLHQIKRPEYILVQSGILGFRTLDGAAAWLKEGQSAPLPLNQQFEMYVPSLEDQARWGSPRTLIPVDPAGADHLEYICFYPENPEEADATFEAVQTLGGKTPLPEQQAALVAQLTANAS
jgi:uncharacterized protein YaiE (UPF0345 family)